MGTFLDFFKNGGIMRKTARPGERAYQAPGAAAVQPQQPVQQEEAKIDPTNAMGSLANMLVPPAEREAQMIRAQQNKAQMAAWTGVFDGLRHLGNLYYASKGAPSQQYTDNPYAQIEQNYQNDMKRAEQLANYHNQYNQLMHSLKRQAEQDELTKNLSNARVSYYKTQGEMAQKKSQQDEEKTKALTEYHKALAKKNYEQAEYWRLRGEGVPEETAAKVAKEYAQARKTQSGNPKKGKPKKNSNGLGWGNKTSQDNNETDW